MRRLLILVLSFWVSLPARAEMPAGHVDPAFQAAIEAWLADDQHATCPLYAMIEAENDAAAMMYLGLRSTGALQDDNGCSKPGISTYLNSYWREDVEERSPVLADWSPWPLEPAALHKLIAAGEPRRAVGLVSEWRLRPEVDPMPLWNAVSPVSNPGLPGDLHHWVLTLFMATASDDDFDIAHWQKWISAACEAEMKSPQPFLPLEVFCFPLDQQDAELFHHTFFNTGQAPIPNRHSEMLQKWLKSDWRTAPYRLVCEEVCPTAPNSCLMPLFNFAGGGGSFFAMQTPSERLISQKRYLSSDRAAGAFWRVQGFQVNYFHSWLRRLRESAPEAACLANALENRQTNWDRKA